MTSLTVRNIPDDLIKKIKTLSSMERRSMNNEILILLERALLEKSKETNSQERIISSDLQVEVWKDLSGKWEDQRSTKSIVNDIVKHRSLGRKVNL